MRQVWIPKAGPPEVLELRTAPDPVPRADEVRIRVEAAGINFADVMGRLGIYPETKHPTYFDAIGLSLEEPLVRVLHANGYRKKKDPVFIQSFEVGNLKGLRRMTDLPLVQLIDAGGRPYDFVAIPSA